MQENVEVIKVCYKTARDTQVNVLMLDLCRGTGGRLLNIAGYMWNKFSGVGVILRVNG